MTFQELVTAIKSGQTVYYKTKANVVVTDDSCDFSFPYSNYAVKMYDGALSYICEYDGVEHDFFV